MPCNKSGHLFLPHNITTELEVILQPQSLFKVIQNGIWDLFPVKYEFKHWATESLSDVDCRNLENPLHGMKDIKKSLILLPPSSHLDFLSTKVLSYNLPLLNIRLNCISVSASQGPWNLLNLKCVYYQWVIAFHLNKVKYIFISFL